MKRHVLILGAGFGGLELATRLSETIRRGRVTLLDRNDSFFFGFSKLEVMLGRQSADEVKLYLPRHREGRRRVPPGDGDRHRPGRAASALPMPAPTTPTSSSWRWAPTTTWRPRRASRPDGHEYYSLAGAERLRDALADFEGGQSARLGARAAVQVPAGAVRGLRSCCTSTSRSAESATRSRWRRRSRCSAPSR